MKRTFITLLVIKSVALTFINAQAQDTVRTGPHTTAIVQGGAKTLIIQQSQNYQRWDGAYEPVNTAVYTRSDTDWNGNMVGVYTNRYQASFPATVDGWFAWRKKDEHEQVWTQLRWRIIKAAYRDKPTGALTDIQNVRSDGYSISGNTITYTSAFNGVPLTITAGPDRLEKYFTVQEGKRAALVAGAPANSDIGFIYELDFSQAHSTTVDDDSTADLDIIEFFENGFRQYFIDAIGFVDANGTEASGKYRLRQKGGKWYLGVGISVATLDGMTGPVQIDPTITIQSDTSGVWDARIVSGAWKNNNYGASVLGTVGDVEGISAARVANVIMHFPGMTDSIPAGTDTTLIIAARLILTDDGTAQNTYADDYELFGVRRHWVEGRGNGAAATGEVTGASSEHSITTWTDSCAINTTSDRYPDVVATVTIGAGVASAGRKDTFNVLSWVRKVHKGTWADSGLVLDRKGTGAEADGANDYFSWALKEHTTAGYRPRLEVEYTLTRITATVGLNFDSISVTVDTSGAGAGSAGDSIQILNVADSSLVKSWPISQGLTDTVTGLSGDTLVSWFPRLVDTGTDTVWGSVADSAREATLAQAATFDTLAGYSPGSIRFSVSQSQNRSATKYAIFDTTTAGGRKWVTASGGRGPDTVWQARSSWVGVISDSAHWPARKIRLQVYAKNQLDSIVTVGTIDSAYVNSLVKTATITRIDTQSFAITTQAETLGAVFAPAVFYATNVADDGSPDTVVTDTTALTVASFISAAHTETTTSTNATLGPNQMIQGRLFRRDNADTTVYASVLDTFFVDCRFPTLDTSAYGRYLEFTSDTSVIFKFNINNPMPGPIFAIRDSYAVAAGSSRTWFAPDSFRVDTAWVDTTWPGFSGTGSDTIKFRLSDRPWPQGVFTNIHSFVFREGDSSYNDIGE